MKVLIVSSLAIIPLVTIAEDVQISFPSAAQNVFSLDFTESEIDDILSHGCWCTMLDPASDHSLLGGTHIDDLDLLCKQWRAARHCNDGYEGGTCNGDDMTGYYTIVPSVGCIGSDHDCAEASCQIDYHFSEEIKTLILNDSSGWLPVTGSTCHTISAPSLGNDDSGAGTGSESSSSSEAGIPPVVTTTTTCNGNIDDLPNSLYLVTSTTSSCGDGYDLDESTNYCIESETNPLTGNCINFGTQYVNLDNRYFCEINNNNDNTCAYNVQQNRAVYPSSAYYWTRGEEANFRNVDTFEQFDLDGNGHIDTPCIIERIGSVSDQHYRLIRNGINEGCEFGWDYMNMLANRAITIKFDVKFYTKPTTNHGSGYGFSIYGQRNGDWVNEAPLNEWYHVELSRTLPGGGNGYSILMAMYPNIVDFEFRQLRICADSCTSEGDCD